MVDDDEAGVGVEEEAETVDWARSGVGEWVGAEGSRGSGIWCVVEGGVTATARRRGRRMRTYSKCSWKKV